MRRSAMVQGSLLLSTALGVLLLAPAASASGPRRPEERSPIFRSAPPPREQRAARAREAARTPDAHLQDDFERIRAPLKRRAVALLVAEIQGLESLLADTPRNSPDRPQLVRRIAEDYAELAASAQRDRIRAEMRLQDLRRSRHSTR